MQCRMCLVAIVASFVAFFSLTGAASAESQLSTAGAGAGQTVRPKGVAVDRSTGRSYVADSGNRRIDVFDAEGNFVEAWGWGVINGAAEYQNCTALSGCQAGLKQTKLSENGIGKFWSGTPDSIAVDNVAGSPNQHDVWVFDFGNHRALRFSPTGEFELMLGKNVEKGPLHPGDVCTAANLAEGDTCEYGVGGSNEGEFSNELSTIWIGVGPEGDLYVAETRFILNKKHLYRVQRFSPSGTFINQVAPPYFEYPATAFAVDSTGDFYFGSCCALSGIRKFDGEAEPLYYNETLEPIAFGIDASDNLFVEELEEELSGTKRVISEYSPSGSLERRFRYRTKESETEIHGIAPEPTAGGDALVSEGEVVKAINFPP